MASANPQQQMMMQPQIILLKEGTDTSQGIPQLLSNITACLAICDILRTTLGPRGQDKLIVDARGQVTISNDGATIMKLLDIVQPAAKTLVDIARSQDAEVGDGTTSVVLLTGELLRAVKSLIEDGASPQVIIQGIQRAKQIAVTKVKQVALDMQLDKNDEHKMRDMLEQCAKTSMSSKLIHSNRDFFTKMVVDAVLHLDREELNEALIGMKKVTGGALEDSIFVDGVAFKKTFSYAGFEQQPKSFENPKILCLNVELELKAEKDNAEVRVDQVQDYQAIVDAEWTIIYEKLQQCVDTGAQVVLSRLPIGDLATQYFADRNIFCAGRVALEDLKRVVQATGASIQSTCSGLSPSYLGSCKYFEERQVGGERYNVFTGGRSNTCTLILRGGAEQFLAEVERSLHDAIMVVRRALKSGAIVAGGGAIEMLLSRTLREAALKCKSQQQSVIQAFGKALEGIPRQLCENAGLDAVDILTRLRQRHATTGAMGEVCWYGVDLVREDISDNLANFVWEPLQVKVNMLEAAAEAASSILSVDETVRNVQSEQPSRAAMRGRGR